MLTHYVNVKGGFTTDTGNSDMDIEIASTPRTEDMFSPDPFTRADFTQVSRRRITLDPSLCSRAIYITVILYILRNNVNILHLLALRLADKQTSTS